MPPLLMPVAYTWAALMLTFLATALTGAEIAVPVRARACRVLGVVAVHQVDAPGDALDAVDGIDQRLARRPGVAGVEAEADAGVADVIPQPTDDVEVAGNSVVAAGGVLQIDRNIGLQLVERLAPAPETFVEVGVFGDVPTVHDDRGGADLGRRVAGVLQDLARRNPHPVVCRRDVDEIRRGHVDRQRGSLELGGVVAWLGRLPTLRVAEKDLYDVSVLSLSRGH